MPDTSQRFDAHIPQKNADVLKKMLPAYGGRSTMRKDECIEFLLTTLADPQRMKQVVASLEPFEKVGLALVKQAGGSIKSASLGIGILASGVDIPKRLLKRDAINDIASHMVTRGLLFHRDRYSSSYGDGGIIFSDPRILAHVGPMEPIPLMMEAANQPSATVVRMPPTVVLEIIGFLQTLENIGRLGTTKRGDLRDNDVRKFQKALQWPDGTLDVDGLPFHHAIHGLIQALSRSDFLKISDGQLVLGAPIEEMAARGYADQVTILLNGFLRTSEWQETAQNVGSYDVRYYQTGRMVLVSALASLPLEPDHFYTLDEFDLAIYARVGSHFSLGGSTYSYRYIYGKTPAEIRQMEAAHQAELRQKWLQRERHWIKDVLCSWLYYLGMVEIGLEGKRVVSFRLTPLGKAVLHPTQDSAIDSPKMDEADQSGGTWIVQPNFDIVVYLDRTTSSQLAFLEKHAERTESQQYTAHYRLTRDSVYRGLESGTTVDGLLDVLAANAQTPLPQNVMVEIREWAGLREQVILHHGAHLVEYATATERDDALKSHSEGRPVGERFLLLPSASLKKLNSAIANGNMVNIEYSHPLPAILNVNETGLITLKKEATDLFLEAQLDRWAERGSTGGWHLTVESIAQQIKAGARITELIALLGERLSGPLPPLLEVALRNWAGRAKTVEVEPFTVVRCTDDATLNALLKSKQLAPYLRGRQEDVLLFDSKRLDEIRDLLTWAGLTLADFP